LVAVRRAIALSVVLVATVPASASTPGARILFQEGSTPGSDLVTLDSDATSYRNLTPGQETFYVSDEDGSWSSDGSQIVFTSHRDSNVSAEIYVMNADGSNQRRLTHDGPEGAQNSSPEVFDYAPAWSPAGGGVAYLKSVRGAVDVWLMKTDGSDQRQLTFDGGTKTRLGWSPDGRRVTYELGGSAFVVPVAGGSSTRLAAGVGLAWAPGGTKIAYATGEGLWVAGPGGDGPLRIATLPAGNPAWSPDGSRIAFVGTRYFPERQDRYGIPSRSDIFVVGADGSGLRRLTGPASDDYPPFGSPVGGSPEWWPDGSRIFFFSQRASGAPTTYLMNPDGTCEGRFAQTDTQLADPRWRPGSAPGLGPVHCVALRITPSLSGGVVNPAGLGQDAVFSFDVDNDGDETATGVRVEVRATAARLTLSGASGCTGPRLALTCALPNIPPGSSRPLSISARSPVAGNFPFTVSVAAVEPDSDPSTNTVSSVVSVLPCTRVGTWGDDVIYGTPGPDRICALTGRDEVYGGKGNDYLDSGNGSDIVSGGPGRDVIIAKGGNDTIYARDGERDIIDCGTERDVAIVDRLDVVRRCETVVRRG
jgi:Tol biopolymer transport system component